MSFLARILARELWWAMLWLMRRRWMKNLQRASVRMLREEKRAKAQESIKRQNAFARRIGLPLMVFAMNLMLGSILVTAAFFLLVKLGESGALTVP